MGGNQGFCSIFKVLSQQRHHCHNVASRSANKYINLSQRGGNVDSVRVVSWLQGLVRTYILQMIKRTLGFHCFHCYIYLLMWTVMSSIQEKWPLHCEQLLNYFKSSLDLYNTHKSGSSSWGKKMSQWWSGQSCPFERGTWAPLAFSVFTRAPSLFSVAMRHSNWSQGFHNSLLEEQKPKQWTKQGRPTQTSSHLTHTSHLWVLCWHTNSQFKPRGTPTNNLFIEKQDKLR